MPPPSVRGPKPRARHWPRIRERGGPGDTHHEHGYRPDDGANSFELRSQHRGRRPALDPLAARQRYGRIPGRQAASGHFAHLSIGPGHNDGCQRQLFSPSGLGGHGMTLVHRKAARGPRVEPFQQRLHFLPHPQFSPDRDAHHVVALQFDRQEVVGYERVARRAKQCGHGCFSLPALADERQGRPSHLDGAGMEYQAPVSTKQVGEDGPGKKDRNEPDGRGRDPIKRNSPGAALSYRVGDLEIAQP